MNKTVSPKFVCLNTPDNFVAGQIQYFWDRWKKITTDRNLLYMVKHGCTIEFDSSPCDQCSRAEIRFNHEEQKIVKELLQKFLDKQIIEEVYHEPGEVLSHIFLRPKPDGSHRLILNLSNLNEHIERKHFKMETLKSVLNLVHKNCYWGLIDIKDAYYHFMVRKFDRKFLRFTWQGKLYSFRCLPNGLSVAPFLWTKLLKPVLSTLRKKGHTNSGYIDDILLQSDSFTECLTNVTETVSLLDDLGLTPHPEKSVTVPTQVIEFVGFILNSQEMTVRLPPRKIKNIIKHCKDILKKDILTIRDFAQIIGKLVASEPGVQYAALYYKPLEIQRDLELKLNKGDFDSHIILSQKSKDCLHWWIDNLTTAFRPLERPQPSRVIESDSSLTGYGAYDVTNDIEISGIWTNDDKEKHINYLELKAAFLALKSICKDVNNEHVRLLLDNKTAIKYISSKGGRKEELNSLAKHIWVWCIQRNIWLSCFHIAGLSNVRADALSRQKLNPDSEWGLDGEIFKKIMSVYGDCDIDMFASARNQKLPCYVSYLPDCNAFAVNAFSLCWNKYYSYLFPPFSCIGSVLQKVEQDKAEGVMVAPLFSTQPWFPKLLQMVVTQPYLLPKPETILMLPGSNTRHPLRKMTLGVFKISGRKSAVEAYQRTLPMLSSVPGEALLENNMGRISRNGCHFVVRNKLINLIHL